MNGNRPNWTPYRSETPSPIQTKLNTIHYVRGNSSRAKTHHQTIKRVRPKKGHNKLFVSFFFFYSLFSSVRFLAQRPAKTARPILTIYTSNDAVSRKEVPFGGPNTCKNVQGGHFPQNTPKLGPQWGFPA